jgi:toxin ParE1/3/4
MIASAMRQVASDPDDAATRSRSELLRGLRSFHLRHTRADGLAPTVKKPPHVLYYRTIRPGFIEIVRVLHERMEPTRHISDICKD